MEKDETKPQRLRRVSERPYDSRKPLIALGIVVLLAALGWWIVSRAHEASQMQDCVMSGRRNCAPIDTTALPR